MNSYPIFPVLHAAGSRGGCDIEGYLSDAEAEALERLRALREELRHARLLEGKLSGLLSAQPSRERVHSLAARVRQEGQEWRLRLGTAHHAKMVTLGHQE